MSTSTIAEPRISKRQLLRERSKMLRARREANRALKAELAVERAVKRAAEQREARPTPEEIAAACEEIQRGWTRTERRNRYLTARSVGSLGSQARASTKRYSTRWSPPEWRCVDFCEG